MSEFSSDFASMRDYEAVKDHAAFPVFIEAMKGRVYGSTELSDAWWWFMLGYEARQHQLVDGLKAFDRETCASCNNTRAWHREHCPRHPFIRKV